MPTVLELFLSLKAIPLILSMYLISGLTIWIGFKKFNIVRRNDVKVRALVMHGTFIFLAHGISVMFYIVVLIFLRMNGVASPWVLQGLLSVMAFLLADGMYFFLANYLWERLAIESSKFIPMTLWFTIFASPWYFLLNLF